MSVTGTWPWGTGEGAQSRLGDILDGWTGKEGSGHGCAEELGRASCETDKCVVQFYCIKADQSAVCRKDLIDCLLVSNLSFFVIASALKKITYFTVFLSFKLCASISDLNFFSFEVVVF